MNRKSAFGNIEGMPMDGYHAKRTEGTSWAERHLEKTYKSHGPNGERVMLEPPYRMRTKKEGA